MMPMQGDMNATLAAILMMQNKPIRVWFTKLNAIKWTISGKSIWNHVSKEISTISITWRQIYLKHYQTRLAQEVS